MPVGTYASLFGMNPAGNVFLPGNKKRDLQLIAASPFIIPKSRYGTGSRVLPGQQELGHPVIP